MIHEEHVLQHERRGLRPCASSTYKPRDMGVPDILDRHCCSVTPSFEQSHLELFCDSSRHEHAWQKEAEEELEREMVIFEKKCSTSQLNRHKMNDASTIASGTEHFSLNSSAERSLPSSRLIASRKRERSLSLSYPANILAVEHTNLKHPLQTDPKSAAHIICSTTPGPQASTSRTLPKFMRCCPSLSPATKALEDTFLRHPNSTESHGIFSTAPWRDEEDDQGHSSEDGILSSFDIWCLQLSLEDDDDMRLKLQTRECPPQPLRQEYEEEGYILRRIDRCLELTSFHQSSSPLPRRRREERRLRQKNRNIDNMHHYRLRCASQESSEL